jgi:hypothetical protein
MITVKSFIEDKDGKVLGFSFSEARVVDVLFAKKNKDGFLEADSPYYEHKIVQPINVNLEIVQLISSQGYGDNLESLDAYEKAVVIRKGGENGLTVLVEKQQ